MASASIIMPCFNHGRFVCDSAKSVLQQTYADLELIIIDDCSLDDSWDIIRGLAELDGRVRPLRQQRNGGASQARNRGLRSASGDFIGFCDADDLWEPGKIEVQLAMLRSNPDYDVTYSDATIINEAGEPTGKAFSDFFPVPGRASGWLFHELIRRNFINIQTVLMRRECLDSVGCFDEGIKWIEDWWFWVQLSRRSRFLYSEKRLASYRVHARSTNVVRRRGYCVNRFKVFRRILRQFKGLPRCTRAHVLFNMAVELQNLGMIRTGRDLLWRAAGLSLTDPRAFLTLVKAVRRVIVPSSLEVLRSSCPTAPAPSF